MKIHKAKVREPIVKYIPGKGNVVETVRHGIIKAEFVAMGPVSQEELERNPDKYCKLCFGHG